MNEMGLKKLDNNKTIFNKKLLERKVKKAVDLQHHSIFSRRKILEKWIKMIESGRLDKLKEEQLQGEFISDIFSKVLRCVNVVDGKEEWNIIREITTKVDGTKADAVIGFFSNSKSDIKALIELKSPKINLDMKQKSRANTQSPIEQAFGYHHKYGKNCKWIIISNYKEIRLYNASDSTEYEVFHLKDLRDDDEFQKFLYLLSFNSLISKSEKSIVEELWEDNIKEQKRIEDNFYKIYHKARLNVFNHIKEKNQEIDLNVVLNKTQKLMDRFIFICFAEDKGLLPENIFKNIVERGKNGYSGVWSEFKGFCQAIDKGNSNHNINKFNGGLFAEDNIFDNLKIDDDIFEELVEISSYDFDSELNENILGHIFEQSISDLEEIKAEINRENFDKKSGKRKKDGVFYTPKHITKYIVENAIGNWLEDRKIELGFEKLPELTDEDLKIDYYKSGKHKGTRKYTSNYLKHIEFWKSYRDAVNRIKILDPACGSGAFLIEAFQYLQKLKVYINEQLGNLAIEYSDLPDERVTLQNNLYGVDLNSESVEITKLALWLKTANKGKQLTTLDNNIKCGNSLIDDEKVAGTKAFKWEVEFKDIINDGGFDVIIGNPPYEVLSEKETGIKNVDEMTKYFKSHFILKNSMKGKVNLYKLFICKAHSLLKKDGFLGFITPMSLLADSQLSTVRKYLLKKTQFILIECFPQKDNPDNRVFEDAKVSTVIFIIKNSTKGEDSEFFVRIHPGRYIESLLEHSLNITKSEIETFDAENLIIPTCNHEDWKYIKKINNLPYFEKLGNVAKQFQGEINETIEKKKDTLTKKVSCPEILRGSNITLYAVREASQGEQYWLDDIKYLIEKKPDSKAFHHNYNRIGFQRSSPQNNFRRIIAAPIEKGFYCFDTVSYVTEKSTKLDLNLLLALLNSKLYDWYFRLISTNSKINEYQFDNLPFFKYDETELNENFQEYIKENRFSELIIKFQNHYEKNKSIPNWVINTIIELTNRIKTCEENRQLVSRKERSSLSKESERYQRYIDIFIYMCFGLSEKDREYIDSRLKQML